MTPPKPLKELMGEWEKLKDAACCMDFEFVAADIPDEIIQRQARMIEVLRAGMEHYESAHYDCAGTPCYWDNTASEYLAQAAKIEGDSGG